MRKRSMRYLALALLLTLAVSISGSYAADFELTWSTADGGGATVSGGEFVLDGTVGQPDASVATGNGFTLEGGFWPALNDPLPVIPQIPSATLRIVPAKEDRVMVTWPVELTNWVVEATTDLTSSNWINLGSSTNVNGPVRRMFIPKSEPMQFFRLREN